MASEKPEDMVPADCVDPKAGVQFWALDLDPNLTQSCEERARIFMHAKDCRACARKCEDLLQQQEIELGVFSSLVPKLQ